MERNSKVIPSSLLTMSAEEIVRAVSKRVLSDIPEGSSNDGDLRQIEHALGRLANDYSYVIGILSYSRNYVRQLKRSGDKEMYEDMMDKKSALEDISSAIKLQYQAVSRMLTVRIETMSEGDLHEYRKGNDQWRL